jgi:ketosteroid isomerase-like protein
MTPSVIAEIEAADARRQRATLDKDRATLAAVLGEDMIYVHGSGTAEGKALYIERVCDGWYDYQSLTGLQREFRVLGDTVLVNGDVRIHVIIQGKTDKQFVSRYLQVWARRAGAWQMVSWQSTPLPA